MKNFIFIVICLLTIYSNSCKKMKKITLKDSCSGVGEWSYKIAHGQQAPWDYPAASKVVHNGALYEANWGGSEEPGSKPCGDVADCRNKGIQWVKKSSCGGGNSNGMNINHWFEFLYTKYGIPHTVNLWEIFSKYVPNLSLNSECATNNGNGIKTWSYKIAHGQQAPWDYPAASKVVHNGRIYEANWGGSEEPGSKPCGDVADCRNKGIQWVRKGYCLNGLENILNNQTLLNQIIGHFSNLDLCNGIGEWSYKIAHGQQAPWDYPANSEVVHNGAHYIANWGGSEEPGSKPCGDVADCRNKGIQWVKKKNCKLHNDAIDDFIGT